MTTWRDACRPIIERTIAQHGTDDMSALRRALREAYPWGSRNRWPYTVWCDEVRRQLGLNADRQRRQEMARGQLEMFKEETDQ